MSRYLHPYEEFYRKLGSSICDTHNTSRSSNTESHRRLQLFKHRLPVVEGKKVFISSFNYKLSALGKNSLL